MHHTGKVGNVDICSAHEMECDENGECVVCRAVAEKDKRIGELENGKRLIGLVEYQDMLKVQASLKDAREALGRAHRILLNVRERDPAKFNDGWYDEPGDDEIGQEQVDAEDLMIELAALEGREM